MSTADLRVESFRDELVGSDGSLLPLLHRVWRGGVPSVWYVEGTCPGAFRAPEYTLPRKHLKASFLFEFGIISLAGWSFKLCGSSLPYKALVLILIPLLVC